ncbi:MAG: hypothetical protein JOZ81_32275 [Chloroflexi bacterium]|nr:hypothetical protein [Chloroflexota bacterium]
MQCDDVTELLLSAEPNPAVDRHLHACTRCAHVARGLGHLNAVLHSALVCKPPAQLQQQLLGLVDVYAPQPKRQAWWSRLFSGDFSVPQLVLRPNVIAAQGLAALMLALASWQVFGWLSTFQPVVGDVGYAVQLVVTSPASTYINSFQLDLQSLGLWSVVGIAGWLISENGLIGRRLPRLGLS